MFWNLILLMTLMPTFCGDHQQVAGYTKLSLKPIGGTYISAFIKPMVTKLGRNNKRDKFLHVMKLWCHLNKRDNHQGLSKLLIGQFPKIYASETIVVNVLKLERVDDLMSSTNDSFLCRSGGSVGGKNDVSKGTSLNDKLLFKWYYHVNSPGKWFRFLRASYFRKFYLFHALGNWAYNSWKPLKPHF